jgi:hypothetical protein
MVLQSFAGFASYLLKVQMFKLGCINGSKIREILWLNVMQSLQGFADALQMLCRCFFIINKK